MNNYYQRPIIELSALLKFILFVVLKLVNIKRKLIFKKTKLMLYCTVWNRNHLFYLMTKIKYRSRDLAVTILSDRMRAKVNSLCDLAAVEESSRTNIVIRLYDIIYYSQNVTLTSRIFFFQFRSTRPSAN